MYTLPLVHDVIGRSPVSFGLTYCSSFDSCAHGKKKKNSIQTGWSSSLNRSIIRASKDARIHFAKSHQSQRIRPNSNWLSSYCSFLLFAFLCLPRVGTAKKTACSFKKPNLLKIQLSRWGDARICTEGEVFLKLKFSLEKKTNWFLFMLCCLCFDMR